MEEWNGGEAQAGEDQLTQAGGPAILRSDDFLSRSQAVERRHERYEWSNWEGW